MIARVPMARTALRSTRHLRPSQPSVASQVRFDSTARPSAVKGPSKPETDAQGSDQRGKATTWALPAVAVALVAGALVVRMTSKESTQSVVNVGVGSGGPDKLKGSKAKGAAEAQLNGQDRNVK